MSKALRFLEITAKHQDFPFFNVFLTIKTLSQNISITLLQILFYLHEYRGDYWRKKLPRTISHDVEKVGCTSGKILTTHLLNSETEQQASSVIICPGSYFQGSADQESLMTE